MGIPFTRGMGFLFTMTMGKLFTMTLGIQLTVSISMRSIRTFLSHLRGMARLEQMKKSSILPPRSQTFRRAGLSAHPAEMGPTDRRPTLVDEIKNKKIT